MYNVKPVFIRNNYLYQTQTKEYNTLRQGSSTPPPEYYEWRVGTKMAVVVGAFFKVFVWYPKFKHQRFQKVLFDLLNLRKKRLRKLKIIGIQIQATAQKLKKKSPYDRRHFCVSVHTQYSVGGVFNLYYANHQTTTILYKKSFAMFKYRNFQMKYVEDYSSIFVLSNDFWT